MLAYHNDPALKADLLSHIAAHREADRYTQGRYWEDGRGCAVGCALESLRVMRGLPEIEHNNHALLAAMTGIPETLHRLQDTIFEGLSPADARAWPQRFAAAPKSGADLSRVVWQFLHWLLTDEAVNPGINHPDVRDAVAAVARIMADMADGKPVAAAAAASAALAAREAAREVAREVARAARAAEAAEAAREVAWAARAAAEAADDRTEVYALMADKLVALMEAAS